MKIDFGHRECISETFAEAFDNFDLGRYYCMEYMEWLLCDQRHYVLKFLEEHTQILYFNNDRVVYYIF